MSVRRGQQKQIAAADIGCAHRITLQRNKLEKLRRLWQPQRETDTSAYLSQMPLNNQFFYSPTPTLCSPRNIFTVTTFLFQKRCMFITKRIRQCGPGPGMTVTPRVIFFHAVFHTHKHTDIRINKNRKVSSFLRCFPTCSSLNNE